MHSPLLFNQQQVPETLNSTGRHKISITVESNGDTTRHLNSLHSPNNNGPWFFLNEKGKVIRVAIHKESGEPNGHPEGNYKVYYYISHTPFSFVRISLLLLFVRKKLGFYHLVHCDIKLHKSTGWKPFTAVSIYNEQ